MTELAFQKQRFLLARFQRVALPLSDCNELLPVGMTNASQGGYAGFSETQY